MLIILRFICFMFPPRPAANGNGVSEIFSAKLQRESIHYKEVVELADVLDCDIVWVKRGARR